MPLPTCSVQRLRAAGQDVVEILEPRLGELADLGVVDEDALHERRCDTMSGPGRGPGYPDPFSQFLFTPSGHPGHRPERHRTRVFGPHTPWRFKGSGGPARSE